MHFINLNVDSLSPKIKKCAVLISYLTNTSVIHTSETKLDASAVSTEVRTETYDFIRIYRFL